MHSSRSIPSAKLPRYGHALIEALKFDEPSTDLLGSLDSNEWQKLIALCDRTQLTLLLGCLGRNQLPDTLRDRIDNDYRNNTTRFNRLQGAVNQIATTLDEQSIKFTILKGFTHAASFIGDPRLRSQGDIDLWFQGTAVFEARDILVDLGYRTIRRSRGRHLDPLIREMSWQWTGDYYAPELPIPVDLHFKLWDEDMEYVTGPAEADVWERRRAFTLPGGKLAWQLCLEDSLAFASLHLLMHLLHGDLRLQRAWEIAYFLQSHPDDHFWQQWQGLYPESVRRLQTAVFALVQGWFGGMVPERIQEERKRLPDDIQLWISHYAWSPVQALFRSNKDELWLNLALLTTTKRRSQVFLRRLLPLHVVNLKSVGAPSSEIRPTATRFALFCRGSYHTWSVPQTCMEGLRWWWRRQRLDSAFLLFSLSSGVFYFGEFVFFLLYNLYLVQCGFHEQAIGQIAAAVTFGTFAGALPATAFTRSFGLGKGLLMAIAGTATSGVLRIFLLSPLALDISAFFNGVSMAFWVVSVPPVVAGITNVKNRTLAFSIITAVGIGVGALAGVVGGTLPGLLQKLNPTATVLQINRVTLLAGCTLLTLALVPVSRLRIKTASPDIDNNRTYPRSRFAMTFLATLFIWSVGTGGFNPFFNVYFSRYQQDSVKSLGLIFSVSQSSQVIAILILPVVIKGMGQVKSVAALQTITGMLLGLLALIKAPFVAAGIYVAYMSFQYASEPYLLSLLMSGVQISERKGASALYFMVTSLAGIIAAWVAGATLERLGYKPTMLACAAITLIAAGLYYRAFRCRALFAPDFNGQTSVLE